MKSALKKVLSLMLVAMLLVTAIPFQASAVTFEDAPATGSDELVIGPQGTDAPTTQPDVITVTPKETDESSSDENSSTETTPKNGPSFSLFTVGPTDEYTEIDVKVNGSLRASNVSVATGRSLKNVVEEYLVVNYADTYNVLVTTVNELGLHTDYVDTDLDDETTAIVGDAKTVEIKATPKQVEVTVQMDGKNDEHPVYRDINTNLTLNEKLINEAGWGVGNGEKILYWEVTPEGGATEKLQDRSVIKLEKNTTVKAFVVKDDGTVVDPSVGTYTVRFFNINSVNHWTTEVAPGSTVAKTTSGYTAAERNVGSVDGYKFSGWKIGGQGSTYTTAEAAGLKINQNIDFYPVFTRTNNGTTITPPVIGGGTTTTPSTGSNKFPYDVTLHIYLNNKVDKPARNVDISDGIAVDGVVSRKEVENVVKQYYTAKNSDGIQYDGLYLAQGNWVSNFANDLDKYDEITGIKVMRQQTRVDINVMVTNANAKSGNNNSPSTNPKTGDSIVMTVSALGITASALAAAYYVSKKRAAK